MPRDRLEDLVRLAMQCDLIGSDSRRILLHGLPSGFVYSLPTVSRPMDQLRFDLMELQRTPRLIGLDRPPLVVWLDNAATHCVTRGDADSARVFARAADDVAPAGVVERIEKDIAAQQPPPPAPQPPPPTPQPPPSDPDSTASALYDVFIAYTKQDRPFADAIYQALAEHHKKRVFLDVQSLIPGDVWDVEIPTAQAQSRATCVLVSPATDKGWYQREEVIQAIHRARSDEANHRIIPVLLGDISPTQMPYGLGRIQGITVGKGDTPVAIAAKIAAAIDRRPGPSAGAVADLLIEPRSEPSRPSSEPSRPLKVLFLADDPRRNDRAALTTEARRIENAIRSNQARDAITIEPRFAVRYQELASAIEEVKPDLVHFAGMGESKGIRLLDENTGKYVSIPPKALARLIGLSGTRIRGVVLNTSHSEALAAALVAKVEFAIGMTADISESAALDFAGAFYGAIARGKSIAAAVEEGEVMMQMHSDETDVSSTLHLRAGVAGDRLILRPGG